MGRKVKIHQGSIDTTISVTISDMLVFCFSDPGTLIFISTLNYCFLVSYTCLHAGFKQML